MPVQQIIEFVLLGFFVSIYGALVGAGGGFIIVPVLLLLPSALDAQLQRDAGLTLYEYIVLSALSEIGGEGVRMSDLAAVTSGQPSRLSQVVTRMEQRDWVARTPDPDDGRATRVLLRPAGKRQLVAAAPGHVEAVRQYVFDELTPAQVQQLARIAMRIASTLTPPDSLIHTRETFTRA